MGSLRAPTRPVRAGLAVSGWGAIYAVVRRIPRGKVASYGQVAALAGRPGHARQVGYALHALPEGTPVPWHRVVNAAGGLSLARVGPDAAFEQRFRLEREGVLFDARGRVPLGRFRWRPGSKRAASSASLRAPRD